MDILPTDVGSRVGVLYLPCGQNMAIMHFIINGEFVVPLSRTIPYNDGPIRAVIDVYGATKRVRIIQVYNGETSINKYIFAIIYIISFCCVLFIAQICLFYLKKLTNRGFFFLNCLMNYRCLKLCTLIYFIDRVLSLEFLLFSAIVFSIPFGVDWLIFSKII